MAESDRLRHARDIYLAFAAGDHEAKRAQPDRRLHVLQPGRRRLDREGYFERCWPGAGGGQEFEFVRVPEVGDEVIVTYEVKHPDGHVKGIPRS